MNDEPKNVVDAIAQTGQSLTGKYTIKYDEHGNQVVEKTFEAPQDTGVSQ